MSESCHTFMNESWHRMEWVRSHIVGNNFLTWMGHGAHICVSCVPHLWMRLGTHINQSCHTLMKESWRARMNELWSWSGTHMNDSRRTYGRVMSHIRKSHVTHTNKPCRTCERMNESCRTYERVMSPTIYSGRLCRKPNRTLRCKENSILCCNRTASCVVNWTTFCHWRCLDERR